MSDISKEKLEKEIEKILKDADLSKTSTKKVIQKLEKNLGVDLTDKKKVIDQLVMDYVNSKESDEDDKDDAEEEPAESEEEERKPIKSKARKSKKGSESDDDYSPSQEEDHVVTVRIPRGQKINKNMRIWARPDQVIKIVRTKGGEEEEPPKKKGRKRKSSDASDEWGKKKSPAKKPAAKGKKGGKGKGSGYTRAYKLSPELAELMGEDEMPRHEVVKRVWEIIKERKLYDPNNKQFAICDDDLIKVIGTKRFRTFGMMKYLKTHFLD